MTEEEGRGPTAVGTLIGERYRIERRLGAGGMASVWLARDERTGREVAVKVLADVLAHDADYVRRFRREAEIASEFDHPNVVEALGSGRAGGRPYLAMEHVAGGTLADRLAAGEPGDADRLAQELLAGLEHIHAAGVVHRDVKPHNVLFTEDGSAKLTDFGIARPEDATKITRTGEVIGTLSYMAPEVQRGEPATVRSDLYSCGIVLKECAGPAPANALAGLVRMLTAERPADRPRSADEALSILKGETGARRTETMPTRQMGAARGAAAGPVAPAAERLRVDPRWALGAAAAVGAVVLLLILLSGGGEEVQQNGAGAERPAIGADEPPTEAPAAPEQSQAEPNAPQQEPAGTAISCEALEDRRDRLKDQKKVAEERVKDDKDAREAVKDRFDAREDALKERIDACKEAEKEADDDGEDD